jgi:hypothetical protein
MYALWKVTYGYADAGLHIMTGSIIVTLIHIHTQLHTALYIQVTHPNYAPCWLGPGSLTLFSSMSLLPLAGGAILEKL